ncbi:MAG TPA: DUF456 domain-containing protein [Xanthomonadales bacterium]|nr:DUF456 domain-containing protein [Xanthomonadales bacterium]
MTGEIALYVLSAVLMLIGFIGVVMPALPGLPLVFAGMLLAAWVGAFEQISLTSVVVLGVLAALAQILDFVASLLGAQRVGASRSGLIGAAIGTLVGLFFGLPGLLLGPFIGAVAGEIVHGRELGLASRVGVGTWIGMIIGAVAKLAIGGIMLGWFLLALLF